MNLEPLGWIGIVRLGLVQASLGAIVVLSTSTLNRIMVVELALPAALPGALVALHYALQVLRPRLGYGSDVGGRRTPWIVGGMSILALGGTGAAVATAWMATNLTAGIALAIVSFVLIGIGVGAAGTTLLVLLASRVDERRRAAAATIVWLMMIAGFVATAAGAGHLLDPYSPIRLVEVAAVVAATSMLLTLLGVWNAEGGVGPSAPATESVSRSGDNSFGSALSQVWAEPRSRRFAIFVFVSMLAYGAQDLILEPFAGFVFGLTPGESAKLSGLLHGGVLVGMAFVAIAAGAFRGSRFGSMQVWTFGGCVASAAALLGLATAAIVGPGWPLRSSVFALGFANGVYAVAAIGSMMSLVGSGQKSRAGVRMGLWGAAQAVAFGLGGFAGTLASDAARHVIASAAPAYATVFAAEAALFLVAATLAARLGKLTGTQSDLIRAGSLQVADAGGR